MLSPPPHRGSQSPLVATRPTHRNVFLRLLVASLAVALLPVIWPQLDLAVAGFFLQPQAPINPSRWPWVWIDYVNEYTPDVFRALALLSLASWIALSLLPRWRRTGLALTSAFLALSLTLGPGVVTWSLKELTLRARPFDVTQFGGSRQFTPAFKVTEQCSDNCAFPSGHTACGFFFASIMLLNPRRQRRWIVLGLGAGALVALARMSVGAHWLSDVLWALPITLLSSGLVWRVLGFFYPINPRPADADA